MVQMSHNRVRLECRFVVLKVLIREDIGRSDRRGELTHHDRLIHAVRPEARQPAEPQSRLGALLANRVRRPGWHSELLGDPRPLARSNLAVS